MDIQSLKNIIQEDVIPALDEFVEEESALFIYAEYGEEKVARITLVPEPPFEHVEEVMRKVAAEVFNVSGDIPRVVVVCEKVKFRKVTLDIIDKDYESEKFVKTMDEGATISAVDGPTAAGIIGLYKLPELEEVVYREFDLEDREALPPISGMVVTVLMHETLVLMELIDKDDTGEEDDIAEAMKADVQFKFSRN